MKIFGKKDKRVIDLSFYMIRTTFLLMSVLSFIVFIFLGKWTFLFILATEVVMFIRARDTFNYFMPYGQMVIDYKYSKLSESQLSALRNDPDNEKYAWDALQLLWEYWLEVLSKNIFK